VVLAPWARVVCLGLRTSRSRGEVERGGDFSCEAETCRGDPFCRELVGDAARWPGTGRLASVGLDQGSQSSSYRIFALASSILTFTLSMVLDYLMLKENLFTVKGGPNPGPRQRLFCFTSLYVPRFTSTGKTAS
jgi:hypothetical protein